MGHTAKFVCPASLFQLDQCAILFVDDIKNLHIDLTQVEPLALTHCKLQGAVTSWGGLLNATGGNLKLEKCFYTLNGFKWSNDSQWAYASCHNDAAYEVTVPLPDGTTAPIPHLSHTQLHKTLGCLTRPDGNSQSQLQHMANWAQQWEDKVQNNKLGAQLTWMCLQLQFWPSIGNGIGCNTATFDDISMCLRRPYFAILHLYGVN